MATPFIAPLRSFAQNARLTNWAGNLTYSTSNVFYPKTIEEVQSLIKQHEKIKVLGTRHCFNTIADSTDNLLSTKEMNKVVSLDANARTVTIEGGMNYGQLCPILNDKGFALHNLASLPHISVAGACTTATHGSGVKNGNLATAVIGLQIVTASGDIVNLSKKEDAEQFNAAVISLGALGVIAKITLALQPAFKMKQYVFERLPLQELKRNFDKIVSAGYSVSLFTDWQNDFINEVWVKAQEDDNSAADPEFYGAKAATQNMHPIAALSAENCTEQMGVPGAWYERMPHFKMGFTPSSGKELQAEYFVPHKHAVDAILAIQRMGKAIGPHLFISEIRTIRKDNLWMSPHRSEDCVAIHFTWKQEWDAVTTLLPVIEKELVPYSARPHWGKIFTMPAKQLASHYEKLDDFKKLAKQYDPKGKFRNAFLDKNIFA